jgi:phosphoglycerol transferase MdoB-like AlkP superfamily enzyme
MLTQDKQYQRMDEFAKEEGFDIVVAKEDFAKAGLDTKYMQGWGVFDRFLYTKAIDQLEAHRDEKVFMTILGCDTHTPSGRLDYEDLKYPPLPNFINNAKPYELKRWLQSIFYHNYDIANFMSELEKRGLWDDETLVIITADHSPPINFALRQLAGYPNSNLARIPLVLLTPQLLPTLHADLFATQLDLAPTLAHLLGVPAPPGWWGRSIFAPEREDGYVGVDNRQLIWRRGETTQHVDLDAPADTRSKEMVDLYNTLWHAPKDGLHKPRATAVAPHAVN